MDSREATLYLTDYVAGRLDASEQAAVAAAVAGDGELQSLEAWLWQVQRTLRLAGGAIFGHPDSDQLVSFALDPDHADADTAAHAASCPCCRDDVAATRALRRELPMRDSLLEKVCGALGRRRGPGSTLAIGGAVLAAGLLAGLLMNAGLVGDDGPLAGPTRTVLFEPAVRGAPAAVPEVGLGDAATVTLLLPADPLLGAGGDVRADLLLLRGDEVVHRWTGAAAAIWNRDAGLLGVTVPAGVLGAGDVDVVLDLDGATVLQRRFRVVP
jgi:hypothetical protein